MKRLTDTNEVGADELLVKKYSRLLRHETAIVFARDNYQHGLKLQHQRGDHSSLFNKGTHQCEYQAIEFTNTSFDGEHVNFSMYKYAIPSPWGMPVLEFINWSDPADVFSNYDDGESTDTTPDFTGDRVDSYLWLQDLGAYLKNVKTAFNVIDADGKYFDQCPSGMDKVALKAFTKVCQSSFGRALFKSDGGFQSSTVLKWNSVSAHTKLLIYLGLLGIDESALP